MAALKTLHPGGCKESTWTPAVEDYRVRVAGTIGHPGWLIGENEFIFFFP